MKIPVTVLMRARRAADAFHTLTGVSVDAAELLTGRAAVLGLSPQGRISAGGATRLMRSSDGWCALTLARQDDVDAVPALVEADTAGDDPWPAVQQWVADNASADVAARARLLGSAGRRTRRNTRRRTADRDAGRPDRTVWHQRLAGRRPVLDVGGPAVRAAAGRAGATVVKVESTRQARRHPRRADRRSSTG